jgi:hypothetical protein
LKKATQALEARNDPKHLIAHYEGSKAKKAAEKYLKLDVERRKSAQALHEFIMDRPYYAGRSKSSFYMLKLSLAFVCFERCHS